MQDSEEILDLLTQWQVASDEIEVAVKVRDIKLFRLSFQKGNKIFEKIKEFILNLKDPDNIPPDVSLKAREAAHSWLMKVNEVQVWQNALKQDIEAAKTKKKATSKINSMYNYNANKVGRNVIKKAK